MPDSATEPIGIGEPETPERDGAFPRLDDEQLDRLRDLGAVREVEPGDVLFAEGDEGSDFFVVQSGSVAIVQGYGDEDRIIAVHGPALDPDRSRDRPQADRLAVLAGYPAPAGVPGAQPNAPSVDRSGGGRERGGAARPARGQPRRYPGCDSGR